MEYKNSYIAFLDVLGFKDLIQTEDFNRVLDIFKHIAAPEDLETALHKAVDDNDESDEGKRFKAYNTALHRLQIYAMSDSIVVSSEAEKDYALDALIDAVILLQNELYCLEKPVLLRGAIAKGEYYCNENIAFGSGMVDAYLYQEHYSRYPRVIISKDLAQEITDKSYISSNDWSEIAEDPGKLFLDDDDYYHVDALKEYLGGKNHEDPECRKFKTLIDKYLNAFIDTHPHYLNMDINEIFDTLSDDAFGDMTYIRWGVMTRAIMKDISSYDVYTVVSFIKNVECKWDLLIENIAYVLCIEKHLDMMELLAYSMDLQAKESVFPLVAAVIPYVDDCRLDIYKQICSLLAYNPDDNVCNRFIVGYAEAVVRCHREKNWWITLMRKTMV